MSVAEPVSDFVDSSFEGQRGSRRSDEPIGSLVFFTLIIAIAVALRASSWGNPTLHIDEEFYFLVGQKMLSGAIPYVDIWDRKPYGLFLIYAAAAAISKSVLSYQILATAFAGCTAYLITRIIRPYAGQVAQVAAASLYLCLLPWLGGYGGQSPVFYNLLVAGAALLIVKNLEAIKRGQIPLEIYAAIALCGLSITIKQTTVFESAYLGLFVLYHAINNGLPARKGAVALGLFAIIGILPTLLIASGYGIAGYFDQFFRAMVTSNIDKRDLPLFRVILEAKSLVFPLAIPLALAASSFAIIKETIYRNFLFIWLCVSVAALFAIPNFYAHYGLPLLLPICALAGLSFEKWKALIPPSLFIALIALSILHTLDVQFHRRSRIQFEYLSSQILAHSPRRTLLVFDGPVYAYSLGELSTLSPVIFPGHLREASETNASGRASEDLLRDILAMKPSAVLFQPKRTFVGEHARNKKAVYDYVVNHCKMISRHLSFESNTGWLTNLYGDCE